MGTFNHDKLQYIIDNVYEIETKTKQYREQYEQMYTICYWSEVKMSNQRGVFKETEIEAVNQLVKFLENLIICSDQVITMTGEVLKDLRTLQSIDDRERCQAYGSMLEEKLDMIAAASKYLAIMQEEYIRCSGLVKKIIEKPSKTSIWDKIKSYL